MSHQSPPMSPLFLPPLLRGVPACLLPPSMLTKMLKKQLQSTGAGECAPAAADFLFNAAGVDGSKRSAPTHPRHHLPSPILSHFPDRHDLTQLSPLRNPTHII